MKTRLVLILVLLVAVAAATTAIIKLRAPKPTPRPSAPTTPAQQQPEAAAPLDAVAAYLNALAALCAERKGPSLDVAAAREHRDDEDRVTVAVPMLDEPGEAGFTTVREQGSWRVVFVQGSPWFPYP